MSEKSRTDEQDPDRGMPPAMFKAIVEHRPSEEPEDYDVSGTQSQDRRVPEFSVIRESGRGAKHIGGHANGKRRTKSRGR